MLKKYIGKLNHFKSEFLLSKLKYLVFHRHQGNIYRVEYKSLFVCLLSVCMSVCLFVCLIAATIF